MPCVSKNFVEIAPAHSVSEINMFFHFMQKFKITAKSGWKTNLRKVASKVCRYPGVKNFVKIALAHCVSKINAFSHLLRNSKWPPKVVGKKTSPINCADALWVKNLIQITLS